MADQNKKKYIKYEDTTYILEDHRLPDPTDEDNDKVLGVVNGKYALKQEAGGLTEEAKQALLDCFENVAWINDDGQTYYDALYAALYPQKTLVSISVSFNQGSAVIYSTDSLDTLKPYLTVTAHYDDSSTSAVTNYTLSGTLNEGTSTVTVLYSGKTTTFTVNVAAPATLVSISAEFTQGSAVIYDTDSLDTLKQYLTVTATMSDSTTRTVTDYTLSGTLTAGTSTITASYGGKTTTFTVTVTQAVEPEYVIPSEYQEVEWVGKDTEYTGTDNTGPFIRTNITEASKQDLNGYTVDITASITSGYSANVAPFIAFASKIGCYFGSKPNTQLIGFSGTAANATFSDNVVASDRNDYHLYWTSTSGNATCKGETATGVYTGTGADAQQLVIGNGSINMAYTKGYKIYGAVVVKKNNTLVGRFVPCYRKSDSVIGFYDTVGEQFYTNSGSSDARVAFAKGADV